jgi:hypothetical protein
MMDVVAEMMIAANSAVAERIAGAFPSCALLRNHPPPRAQAFEQVGAGGPRRGGENMTVFTTLRACSEAASHDEQPSTEIHLLKN